MAYKRCKKKTKSGPRPTPTGLRPQHPERGGTEGGNAQQHETQAAAQEQTESEARAPQRMYTSPQAQHRHSVVYKRCIQALGGTRSDVCLSYARCTTLFTPQGLLCPDRLINISSGLVLHYGYLWPMRTLPRIVTVKHRLVIHFKRRI
jgi:hypothetical protein